MYAHVFKNTHHVYSLTKTHQSSIHGASKWTHAQVITRKRKAQFLFSGHFGEAGGVEIPPCKLAKGTSKHLHHDYVLLADSNKHAWWAVGRFELTDIGSTSKRQPCSVGGNTGSWVSGKTRIHPICILSRKCFYIFEFNVILGLNIYEDFFPI